MRVVPRRSAARSRTRRYSPGAVLLVLRDVTSARRLDAVRTDFVANASHELKTPVASIQAVAETLQAAISDDPAAVARFTDQLEREAHRLSRIVSDLLDLSRLESTANTPITVDFATLVREETDRLRSHADEAGIAMTCTTPERLPLVGDERDLRSVVRNLVDNALRYTREGGHVDVEAAKDGDLTTLQIRDDGVGIPQRDIPRIFERFYRVDRARA